MSSFLTLILGAFALLGIIAVLFAASAVVGTVFTTAWNLITGVK